MRTYEARIHRGECRCAALLGVATLISLAACGVGLDPDEGLPRGAYVAGDAQALRRVLAPLEALQGTPLARVAGELSARLAPCRAFEAHDASGSLAALFSSLACSEAPLPAALAPLRGSAPLVFLLPLKSATSDEEEAPRLRGWLDVAPDGSVFLDARLYPTPRSGGLAFVVPDRERPGAPILNSSDLLLQLRLRPADGLDIAALVPEGSQGDDLFKLKSELFAGAVLDGSLEVAVYMPRAGQVVAPMALAVGVSIRSAAVAAMDRFLSELEATWPLHATPARFGDDNEIAGRCILDLQILPEFAPCYAATDRALVVGWNPPSLAQALAARRGPGLDERGGLFVALSRLPEADRRLRRAIAPTEPRVALDYGWHSLRIAGRRGKDDEVRVSLELASGEAS